MIKSFTKFIDNFVKSILFFCFLIILAFSFFNIILRWFQISQQWIDPFVRHLVLLIAFLGGYLATVRGNHIAINLFEQKLKTANTTMRSYLHIVVNLCCFLMCLLLVKVSISFSFIEFEYGQLGFLAIHSGYLVSIIPFGFGLLSLRFLINVFLGIYTNLEVEKWKS